MTPDRSNHSGAFPACQAKFSSFSQPRAEKWTKMVTNLVVGSVRLISIARSTADFQDKKFHTFSENPLDKSCAKA
jgi:hypothetical protein